MAKQKIIKVGNSLAVTIPKEVLEKTGWKSGDEVVVEADRVSDGSATEYSADAIAKSRYAVTPELTPEFLEWLKDFHKQYGADLRELAKR